MIVFVDVETTGLEADKDLLLELSMIAVDDNLEILSKFTSVIGFHESSKQWLLRYGTRRMNMNDGYVLRMHTENGLWDEVLTATKTAEVVMEDAIEWMIAHVPAKPLLAGNSITLDRNFLAQYMPELHEMFHYRSIDVSTIRELCKVWRPGLMDFWPPASTAHRGLSDCENSIEMLRFFKKNLFNPGGYAT
jgi:oligoribonuclease